jgi:hypothetical protein
MPKKRVLAAVLPAAVFLPEIFWLPQPYWGAPDGVYRRRRRLGVGRGAGLRALGGLMLGVCAASHHVQFTSSLREFDVFLALSAFLLWGPGYPVRHELSGGGKAGTDHRLLPAPPMPCRPEK